MPRHAAGGGNSADAGDDVDALAGEDWRRFRLPAPDNQASP